MSRIEKSIDVNVPLSTAYNQWTQFEEFPRFMEGIEEVRQLDDKRLHWRANIGGKREEWDAEIVQQVPDQRLAWRSTSGAPNSGVVTFESLATSTTRVQFGVNVDANLSMSEVSTLSPVGTALPSPKHPLLVR